MMVSWLLCVGLLLLHCPWSLDAKLHYAVIFPSELRSDHPEEVCIQLEGAQGESRVEILLNLEDKNTTLTEKTVQDSTFTCIQIQVPDSKPEEQDVVATLVAVIENGGETIRKSTKVLLKKAKSGLLIQTDKAVYKPGQKVHFRILAINEDYQPENRILPLVEIQDPGKNRIRQWLNVNTNQRIAEFSFPLSSEPLLGEYSIRVGDEVQPFTVEEYVLPKFETSLVLPKSVGIDSKSFTIQICSRYTYGKPVNGQYSVSLCRSYSRWYAGDIGTKSNICHAFTGELDESGCSSVEVETEDYKLNGTGLDNNLKAEGLITEQGTGIQLSTSSQTTVSLVVNKVSYIDQDYSYKAGIPCKVVVKVTDANDNPKQDMKLYFYSRDGNEELVDTSVTDNNGIAVFILNTTDWDDKKNFVTKTRLEYPEYVAGFLRPDYGQAYLSLHPFYSKSKSFLKLYSVDQVLPCGGEQEVQVEYIIKHTELKDYQHLDLHYLVTYMGSIQNVGSLKINVEKKNEDLHGTATFKLPVSTGKSSTLRALVYILLPDGEILADSAKYNVQKCFKNKVLLGFAPEEVLPGSDVSIQVQAAPGSLCGLRVVDKSVMLMKPDKELTADKVYNLFPFWEFELYDHRIRDDDDSCGFPDFRSSPFRTGRFFRPWFRERDRDVSYIFQGLRLKILTSAEIKKPLNCEDFPIFDAITDRSGRPVVLANAPAVDTTRTMVGREKKEEEERIRSYFPDTFLFELIAVGTDGSAELHKKSPDTITDWNGGAVCLGPSGFGLSPPASLRVFQPFFVDTTLPYSVVRGEIFTLKASTFNYMKYPMKIQSTLYSSDLEEMPCEECPHSSCIGADESETFSWIVKSKALGKINITVKTEALNTEELCKNEIPIVPKQGGTDTMVKSLLVQPGGIPVEKSFGSLMCINAEKDNSKTEEVSLKVPGKILENSERAYITVLGDLMGSAMENLDRLLAMPYGCGEQNMVLFVPNIFILEYLQNTHLLTPEIKNKAIGFLDSGLQRQLTYKRKDGSYSAFGQNDPQGNTWLTAFVVKSYSKSRPYIFIHDSHLNESITWLKNTRSESGCFRSMGRLFNNAMKGGVEDDLSLSTYVTLSLLEAGLSIEEPFVRDSVTCLKKEAVKATNVYTLALMAYAFTLSGDDELREDLLRKLEEKAVIGDGQIHWKRDTTPPKQDSYWYQAPSADVELNAYMLLTILSGREPDLAKAAKSVNWISKQQNANGGFSSTQDTVVALQALAKYASMTYSDKGDISIEVTSKTGFLETFHVDNKNRLLLQRATLPAIPGEYSVKATGSGCVFVQAVLKYNIPPPKTESVFSLTVETSSKMECHGEPVKTFEIGIRAAYTGSRNLSNMAVIEVKMLSGFIPVKSTIRQLEKDKVIKRSDIQVDKVILYFDQLDSQGKQISFTLEQDIEVKDLKPATVEVYDYYETDDRAAADYNHPCSSEL